MIKQFRHKHDLTQAKLASLSGVSRQTVSDVERGKYDNTPKAKQLYSFVSEYTNRVNNVNQYKPRTLAGKVIDFFASILEIMR